LKFKQTGKIICKIQKLFKIKLEWFCKNYEGKNRKEIEKEKEKELKGRGKPFGLEEESVHSPASPRSRTGNLSLSFSR
jgi:hypothetical protein